MKTDILSESIELLSQAFREIKWNYLSVPSGSPQEKTQLWPGKPEEDVTLCIYKGKEYFELFHRQDYFFVNFA